MAKARIKLLLILLLISSFVYITTSTFNKNLIYQITLFIIFTGYFLIFNKAGFKNFINFAKFLLLIIIILHTIFFTFKVFSMSYDFALTFYKERWKSIVIRIFIIPNIFAFVNILISKIDFIDIILLSRKNNFSKAVYILMISGVDVMERLRIYYEHHPENYSNKGFNKISHYLAVPLTLFFGIYRGFEIKYKLLKEREIILNKEIKCQKE